MRHARTIIKTRRTYPLLWQVAGPVHGCRFECPVRGMFHDWLCCVVCQGGECPAGIVGLARLGIVPR